LHVILADCYPKLRGFSAKINLDRRRPSPSYLTEALVEALKRIGLSLDAPTMDHGRSASEEGN
jgi:hypothetical protein